MRVLGHNHYNFQILSPFAPQLQISQYNPSPCTAVPAGLLDDCAVMGFAKPTCYCKVYEGSGRLFLYC